MTHWDVKGTYLTLGVVEDSLRGYGGCPPGLQMANAQAAKECHV